MTENQIQFLIEHFFSKDTTITNTSEIARKLILDSTCIVAGLENPWKGGIGNFITDKPTPGAYNCTTLTFNKADFFKSFIFKEELAKVTARHQNELYLLNIKTQEILSLL